MLELLAGHVHSRRLQDRAHYVGTLVVRVSWATRLIGIGDILHHLFDVLEEGCALAEVAMHLEPKAMRVEDHLAVRFEIVARLVEHFAIADKDLQFEKKSVEGNSVARHLGPRVSRSSACEFAG